MTDEFGNASGHSSVGIKDSGLGYKEGVVEAMKSFTNVRTYSLPW